MAFYQLKPPKLPYVCNKRQSEQVETQKQFHAKISPKIVLRHLISTNTASAVPPIHLGTSWFVWSQEFIK